MSIYMKISISKKLLLIIAALADYNRSCFSWQLALAMPDDPRRFKYRRWLKKMLKNKKENQKLYTALHRFKKAKLLEEKIFYNSKGYVLTPKGYLKFYRSCPQNYKLKKYPNKKYLMVFFDIPEKERQKRDDLRFILRELGFQPIQKSVWATEYQVEKQLQTAITNCALERYVKPLIVQELPANY